AEIFLSRATQAAPELALARQLLITTYLRSGQSAKALAFLNAGAGKDGIDPRMFSLAGEVYLQNGDAKTAEEYFTKALKLDPDNVAKRTALAVTHLTSGQTSTALEELVNIAMSDTGTSADMALISAHLRRKEFDKALAAIDKLEAKQPDKPVAAYLRGRVQLAQKDTIGARKSFERALAIAPTYFAAAASLATLDVADKMPDDARRRFESLLVKDPKNGQALLALAELAALRGAGEDEVAGLLKSAVEANPTDVKPRLLSIELQLRTNDAKQALSMAQSAVAILPNSYELLSALGRSQQLFGDLNQAIATYNKVIGLQPQLPQPYMLLAGAQLANKNTPAAEQSLRKALEIEPDYLAAQRGLIIVALDSKKYQDAITIAQTVQKQRPKSGVGWSLEGDINAARKNWSAAANSYRAALQQVQEPELAVKLYAVMIDAGKTKEAEQFAATWMQGHPKDSWFPAYLGAAAIARKDYAAAEALYLAVLRILPDDAIALNNMAWVTNQLHKEGALAYAERANKLAPGRPDFMDTMAVVLSQKGEHSKAVEVQLKALELQPKSAVLRLNLAKIYLAAGDKNRAKSELDALAKLGNEHPSHAEVMALLKPL
ncbi:MAG: PEP-CTERM system TPR-repeat protein PrsT, partial [Rhodoferax sp.]|nr:PEP-CTERM system TPR-repeat protein PrsT [Rhodoferax sp.]